MLFMKNAIYTYLQRCPPALEFFKQLERAGNIYLIGGVLREFRDHGKIINLRDIDIIVDISHADLWENLLDTYHFKTNRFGGYKLQCQSLLVDTWKIEETWAFRNNIIRCTASDYVMRLPETVFLNVDSIIYDWTAEKWYDAIYQKAMQSNVLDVVLAENPQLLLNIIRAFVLKDRYHMQFSDKLKCIILDALEDDRSLSDFTKKLYMEQIRRYKSEILPRDYIYNELKLLIP